MLNIGEKIFIPNYGAGVVLDIDKRNFTGSEKEYIIIYLIVDDMDLLIPIEKINSYKIRPILNISDMEQAMNIINQVPIKIEMNWNKRYRKNRNKIGSGNINDMCEVLRDIYYLKEKEELPVGEEKIFEKTMHLIVSEIMLVFSINVDEAYNKIKK